MRENDLMKINNEKRSDSFYIHKVFVHRGYTYQKGII